MKHLMVNIVLGLLLFITACSSPNDYKQNGGKRLVVVSIEPMRYFTEQIAGDDWEVVCMVPKGSSPETYEPTPGQLMRLVHSQAYFRVGPIGFEQLWMDRLSENAPQMKIFDAGKGIQFIYEKEVKHENHVHVGGIEPHIWTAPSNVRLIADNIYHALCELSPSDSLEFKERWQRLDNEILTTDSLIRHTLDNQSVNRSFLIYHPTLSYFAREYGLSQLSIEESGKEPSPAHIKSVIDKCKNQHVKTVFIQLEFNTRNAELIATELGTKPIVINPLSYDWAKELINISKALTKNE